MKNKHQINKEMLANILIDVGIGDENKIASIEVIKELKDILPTINLKLINRLPISHPHAFYLIKDFFGRSFGEKLFNALNPGVRSKHLKCPTCLNKTDKFCGFSSGYSKFCSVSCSSKNNMKTIGSSFSNPETIKKIKKTNLERYGTECFLQHPDFKEKTKKTNLEKFGTEFPSSSCIIKEKVKQTCLERYGVERPLQSSIFKDKLKTTNLERYGVEQSLQSKEIREKIKLTCLERYGVENPYQAEVIKDKIKSTNLERFGVECSLQDLSVREKGKATMLEKYGVENPSQSIEIRNKSKVTNMERYGVEHALQSPIFLEKVRNTNLANLGVEYPMQSQVVRDKSKATNLELYGVDNPAKAEIIKNKINITRREKYVEQGKLDAILKIYKDIFLIEPLFTTQEYINGKAFKWKHTCGMEYETSTMKEFPVICPNPECRKQSSPQKSIYEYIKSIIEDDIKVNTREIISPYELDIYIPTKKIAIEMDGIYWHQNEKEKLDKQMLCKQLGIQLIHITDLSWYEKTDIWKSMLSSKLHIQNRIYARSCIIETITSAEAKQFLNDNHIQGFVPHKIAFGLYNNNILVAMMSFGAPRFNKNYKWELLRYASIKNLTVVGGASRLLKSFRTSNQGSIVTYAKKEYSEGNLYRVLGFTLLSDGSKSYHYLKGDKKISRYQAQKHKLEKLLGTQNFDPALSEQENMSKVGYIKIQERGSLTYIMEE